LSLRGSSGSWLIEIPHYGQSLIFSTTAESQHWIDLRN